jgi:transposase
VISQEDPRDATIARQALQIEALLAAVARLEARVQELEAQLRLHSGNSSKPPSSDGPSVVREAKTKTGKKRGGQPGHKGHTRSIQPSDAEVRYEPSACAGCGGALGEGSAAAADGALWQVAELPVMKAHITSHVAAGRVCGCGQTTYGHIPASVLAHGYGPRYGALVSLLTTRFGMSRRDVQELSLDVFGVSISTGTVCALGAELGVALQPSVDDALTHLRAAAVVHADETGWPIQKEKAWLWAGVGGDVSVFLCHSKRSAQGAQALLGTEFSGTLVTDRWGAYNDIAPLERRQFCLAHLLRDAQGMVERGGEGAPVGRGLVTIFRAGIALFHDVDTQTATRETRLAGGEVLRAACKTLLETGALLNEKRDSKTRGICNRLRKSEQALWTFLTVPHVEPTNNIAERAVRPAVIVRKTSFGSGSTTGAQYFARILTAVATLRMQKRKVFTFLEDTLHAAREGLLAPALVSC